MRAAAVVGTALIGAIAVAAPADAKPRAKSVPTTRVASGQLSISSDDKRYDSAKHRKTIKPRKVQTGLRLDARGTTAVQMFLDVPGITDAPQPVGNSITATEGRMRIILSCTRGRERGMDEVRTRFNKTVRIKWPIPRPTRCTVTVHAALDARDVPQTPGDVWNSNLTYRVYATRV